MWKKKGRKAAKKLNHQCVGRKQRKDKEREKKKERKTN